MSMYFAYVVHQRWTWCSRWDLNPHARRAYASETYVSTIPPPEQVSEAYKIQIHRQKTQRFFYFSETKI